MREPERPAVLPATAGTSLAPLLRGRRRSGRVLSHHGGRAAYIRHQPSGRVLAVVTADALQLPNALVVHRVAGVGALDALAAGVPVELGPDTIRAPGLAVRVTGWRDRRLRVDGAVPATVRARADEVSATLATTDPPPPDLVAPTAALAAALRDRDGSAVLAAADRLIGRGPGLTPSGDDVLAGALAAHRALARSPAGGLPGPLADTLVQRAAGRTTALSATLLWHAARGEPARPARGLLVALVDRTPLRPAVRRLLDVGHTSGRDLALGIVAGAGAGVDVGTRPAAPSLLEAP